MGRKVSSLRFQVLFVNLKLETKLTLNKNTMSEIIKIYEDKPSEAAIKKVVAVLKAYVVSKKTVF